MPGQKPSLTAFRSAFSPALAVLLGLLLVPAAAPARAAELVRLVDSFTPIPGSGSDTFFLDKERPSVCGLGVVFTGLAESDFSSGIYVASGGAAAVGNVAPLVTEADPVPGGEGHFEDLGQAHCDGVRVAFQGKDSVTGRTGIYEWEGGQVTVLADVGTPLPGTMNSVQGLGAPRVAGERTSFSAVEAVSSVEGLYLQRSGGGFVEITDTSVSPPDDPDTFASLTPADLGDEAAFRGTFPGFRSAIYAGQGASPGAGPANDLRVVADDSTPVPTPAPGSGGETFRNFKPPSVWEGQILFVGGGTSGSIALYLESEGMLKTVVPHLAPLPRGGNLASIETIDTDRGVHAFEGFAVGEAEAGLYLAGGEGAAEGELTRVLGEGDFLDGRRITDFTFSLESGVLAVWVLFADSSQAIYAGALEPAASPAPAPSIPALSGLGLMALALALGASGLWWLRGS